MSLSMDNHSDVIEAFNSSSRYLNDLLNIDNYFFDSMVNIFNPENFGEIRSTCQIPKPHFWIYIYLLYRMVLLRLKFMINEMILIL